MFQTTNQVNKTKEVTKDQERIHIVVDLISLSSGLMWVTWFPQYLNFNSHKEMHEHEFIRWITCNHNCVPQQQPDIHCQENVVTSLQDTLYTS